MEPRRERKIVTVLFADLVGFTARAEQLDPEDVEAILRPYHERLRSELERFGGTVEKFIGDAVMALFGAPVAHEDDPERAVRAALAIRDWARETEVVSTQSAFVGRARELDQLVDALARARQESSTQLVTIVGVPGIGKSRLVYELWQLADADPEIIFWRHGRSLPYGDGVTFSALVEMVKAQLGILETDPAEDAAAKLRVSLADLVPEGERTWIEARL